MEKTNVSLNHLVEVSLELLDYDLRASGIRVVRELEPSPPMVFADPNQLEQVFLNIVNNAIQAMEGNPREKVLKVKTDSTSSHARVSFQDYGKGIAAGILDKIFDPFFTTKEVGVGTGLGLSISYSIIKEHSGNIFAQNHAEGGAAFSVELPISHIKTTETEETGEGSRPSALAIKGSHRLLHVLLVDDETSLHEVFSEMLSAYSCHVQGAINGLQAMDLIQQQDFDLIISDLKMPGMDGRRFYEKVHEVKPHLVKNFVFVTGDTNSPKTLEFLQNSGCRWIHKPFTFREVEDLVSHHFERALSDSKTSNSKIRQVTPGHPAA
jgi:CheY-like chemotaxis protein